MRLKDRSALKAYMEFRRMSGVDLAKAARLSPQIVSFLVTDKPSQRNTCSRQTAERIEDALGCPRGFLFDERVLHVSASRNGSVKEVA